jgi:hypothetical protein
MTLSIIVPFAGEYPQALFTIQSLAQPLIGSNIDFEIIAVDNYCEELEEQWRTANLRAAEEIARKTTDSTQENFDSGEIFKAGFDRVPKCHQANKAGDAVKASAGKGRNPWLKYMAFDGWLSHWECKRLACEQAQGDTFLFIDAHCVTSANIADMYRLYNGPVQTPFGYEHFDYSEIGTMHMPLTYKILEWHRLIYKMVVEKGFWGYSFTGLGNVQDDLPIEVPCMSTCGMMISRKVYETIGGWPRNFKAYGGGENFMNYALAVCGFRKFIDPNVTCHHHGEKRDYHYTYDGTLWNRMAAHYIFGGDTILLEYLNNLIENGKGKPHVLSELGKGVTAAYAGHRNIIEANQEQTLTEFLEYWDYKVEG